MEFPDSASPWPDGFVSPPSLPVLSEGHLCDIFNSNKLMKVCVCCHTASECAQLSSYQLWHKGEQPDSSHYLLGSFSWSGNRHFDGIEKPDSEEWQPGRLYLFRQSLRSVDNRKPFYSGSTATSWQALRVFQRWDDPGMQFSDFLIAEVIERERERVREI